MARESRAEIVMRLLAEATSPEIAQQMLDMYERDMQKLEAEVATLRADRDAWHAMVHGAVDRCVNEHKCGDLQRAEADRDALLEAINAIAWPSLATRPSQVARDALARVRAGQAARK